MHLSLPDRSPKPPAPRSKSPGMAPAASPAKGPAARKPQSSLRYVIQKHRASQLHYDFRLEWNGVLLFHSQRVVIDPSVKRLASVSRGTTLDYAISGVIPEGEYGGTVMVWDTGTWTPDEPDVDAALRKGDLKFSLNGAKLKGSWVLVRTQGYGSRSKTSWLLIKHRDQYASTEDITVTQPQSVTTKRLLSDIAREGGGDVEKLLATGDPAAKPQEPIAALAVCFRCAPAR